MAFVSEANGFSFRRARADEDTAVVHCRVPFEDLERFDTVRMLTSYSYLFLFFLTGSGFISWLFQAHRSDRMDRTALQYKSFWAIWGWFVPVMSPFRPYRMVQDVRDITSILRNAPSQTSVRPS